MRLARVLHPGALRRAVRFLISLGGPIPDAGARVGFAPGRMAPVLPVLGLLAGAAMSGGVALAQPAPKLNALSTEWIQRGATLELTLTGENLGGVTNLLILGEPGLTATQVVAMAAAPGNAAAPVSLVQVESTGGGIARVQPVSAPSREERKLTWRVTASPGASLAPREIRVVAPGGVSNPLNLNVGQWPERTGQDGLPALVSAPLVTLPAVLVGSIQAANRTNHYRFKAVKGEEFVFEVDASRRGSPLDSSLAVLDREGRELARNEDALGLDSLLLFTAPVDGEFVLAVRDFRFRGGNEYSYRLTAGPIPYVETFFPFGGRRGSTATVAVAGRNLAGITQLALEIAPNAPGNQELRVKTARGDSNLIPFHVTDLPEVLEKEPNQDVAEAQSLRVPVLVNGRLGMPGDMDRFRFKSDADQKLVVEVAAQRFGSRLDALLILTDTNGTILAQNDDAAGTDARLEFDAKKGAEYLLALRDLTDRGGDRFAYRLSVRPPSAAGPAAGPAFSARYLGDVTRIHRGGTARLRCEVSRSGGFDGPVRFTCDGLPPGVHAEPLVVPNAPHSGLMVLSADSDAPLGSVPLRVIATGTIAGKAVSVSAEPLNGDRAVRGGFLSVLEPVPFTLDVTTLGVELEQNQSGAIEVFALRRDGFAGEIKLVAEGFSAGREPATRSFGGAEGVIKAGESLGRIPLTARIDSEIGIRTVLVRGEATVDGREVRTFSRTLPVRVSQYPLLISSTLPRLSLALLPPGSTSAAGEAETKIRVERRGGFNGDVELALEGLPAGVRSEVPRIPAGVGEVALKLFATDKAKVGTNYSITVVGTAVFEDRNYKTRTGAIGLTIGLPEPVEVAATNAPPAVPGRAAGPTLP